MNVKLEHVLCLPVRYISFLLSTCNLPGSQHHLQFWKSRLAFHWLQYLSNPWIVDMCKKKGAKKRKYTTSAVDWVKTMNTQYTWWSFWCQPKKSYTVFSCFWLRWSLQATLFTACETKTELSYVWSPAYLLDYLMAANYALFEVHWYLPCRWVHLTIYYTVPKCCVNSPGGCVLWCIPQCQSTVYHTNSCWAER